MSDAQPAWFLKLSEEDQGFIKRFLLASGSLKQLAKDYGITYPTVRLRLDRPIHRCLVPLSLVWHHYIMRQYVKPA